MVRKGSRVQIPKTAPLKICLSSVNIDITERYFFMAKKGDKRKIVGLTCEACGQRHYYSTKNTMNTPEKLELMKYCPVKRVNAKQGETKKNLGRNVVPKRK